MVKNPPANTEDARDAGLISELGISLEQEMTTYSSILAWKSPWTEESGRLQSMGSQRLRHDLATEQQPHIHGLRDLGV